MSARLSLFTATWDAARMPLALPVHEPVFREQPWLTLPVSRHADQPTDIRPVNARGDASIMLMPPHSSWSYDAPAVCANWPAVIVMTTPTWVWETEHENSGFEDYDYESAFFFGDRAGFERAYRAARTIAAGRPAFEVISGGRATYNDTPQPPADKMFTVLAPAHRHLASYELKAAHEGARGVTHFGNYGDHAKTACRACGRSGLWWSEWEEPDLCGDCRHRETDVPCGGFAGTCDRCLRESRRLLLMPLTSFAMCPPCRQGKPIRPRKGARR